MNGEPGTTCPCGRPARIYSGATDANYCSVQCAEVARLEAEIKEVEAQTAAVQGKRPEIEGTEGGSDEI